VLSMTRNRARPRALLAAVVGIAWLVQSDLTAAEALKRHPYQPSDAVVERLSLELTRLERAAAAEERRSPDRPAPSRELAYMLLSGLAAQGPAPETLDADTIARLAGRTGSRPPLFTGRDPRERRTIVRCGPRLWIVFVETALQDKAGSFVEVLAVLYVKTGAAWQERGRGEAVIVSA
jgi:hypothetical protein